MTTIHCTPANEQFYPFCSSVAKKLREANLSAAEWRFWSFLTEHEPWGDRYKELDSLDIMRECRMSKATYYRAKAKFQELGLFDFQESKVSFKNLAGISQIKQWFRKFDPALKNETAAFKNETVTFNDETEVSKMRQESQERENQPLKLVPSKVSKVSQTIQTYSDLLQTLSEGARENFEKFCLKKIEECSFKIASSTAWLNKYGTEYLHEFRQRYSEALINPQVTAVKSQKSPLTVEEEISYLKRLHGSDWKNVAVHHGLISPDTGELALSS